LLDEDFWLLDDGAVLIMRYDDDGRFLGAEPARAAELPMGEGCTEPGTSPGLERG
jgi:hypothetical protein